MALTGEWEKQITNWRKELQRQLYTELGNLDLDGFTTRDMLPFEKARKGPFRPLPVNTQWGKKWQYAWFRGQVRVPAEAAGKRLVCWLGVESESLVYVDGKVYGSWGSKRQHVTLSRRAKTGQVIEVMAEAYAGHGPTPVSCGPVPPGRLTVPEPEQNNKTLRQSTFGVWNEEVYQLCIDVETLAGVRESIDPDSLRVSEIDAGLRDFVSLVDFEAPRQDFLKGVRAARKRFRPLLECRNGSTTPTMYAFGHGHLDVAWLWPLAETKRKAARTLGNQLTLAREYPEHRFIHSQAHLFRFVKEYHPELWRRVKQAVRKGQVIAEGGMWVEADTNVSGGESLIRQFIHGKRFFGDEFGVDCELLWLPDVFGYSAALPQILAGCGIKYFATAKIYWNYNGGDPFPHTVFTWKGIDGSEVLVHLCNNYNSQIRPGEVVGRWKELRNKDGVYGRLFPFGWGDGGGGPTRDHLEFARREEDLEGVPHVRLSSPIDYFQDQEKRGVPDTEYVGELYFQAHRGTYTSQARTKKGNRVSERALREAEMWASAARTLSGFKTGPADLDEEWKKILLNQFHDVLPGSSIRRVYEEAEAMHAEATTAARKLTARACTALAGRSKASCTVFNSLSWDRDMQVELPGGFEGAQTSENTPVPVQNVAGRTLAEVRVPSCGWVSLRKARPVSVDSGVKADKNGLENELLRVRLNKTGEIVSVYDKQHKQEYTAGACNSLRMYRDVPTAWDAWDLDSTYEFAPVALDSRAEITVEARGALVGIVKVVRRLNTSAMTQHIVLRRNSRRIDFRTTIDWRESHKLLKVNFPVAMHADQAVHEIQFGHVRRPTHRSRPFDTDRFEVCNHTWTALAEEGRGAAVLNDSKYGVNVRGNSINLTLLKSPLAPDMTADKGMQEFTYALYVWEGSLKDSGVVRQGYDLNCPSVVSSGSAGERSLFSLDTPNVVIDTVKPAEDGSSDIIVRLYESMRTATNCTLSTTLPVHKAARTTMLEEHRKALPVRNGRIRLALRPFEVETIRLSMK